MLTKNQFKILQVFVSNFNKKYSIREISRLLKMNNSLTHRTIKPLIKLKILLKDDKGFLYLDCSKNHDIITYTEYLRRNDFLKRSKNKLISILAEDIYKKFPLENFCLLIFGSAVYSKTPRDIDLLLIIEKTDDVGMAEKDLYNITRNFTIKIHPVIISVESFYEMILKREELNVINETLKNHIILYGAEVFYKLIMKGRK